MKKLETRIIESESTNVAGCNAISPVLRLDVLSLELIIKSNLHSRKITPQNYTQNY